MFEHLPYLAMERTLGIIEELRLWNPDWDFAAPMREALAAMPHDAVPETMQATAAMLATRAVEAQGEKLYHVWAAYMAMSIYLSARSLSLACPDDVTAMRIQERALVSMDRLKEHHPYSSGKP